MANPKQIGTGIIEASFGILGVCIMAFDFLCIFVILCILIFARQVKAIAGASNQIP